MPKGYGPLLPNCSFPAGIESRAIHDTANFATRANWINNSREVEMIGKFYIGLFGQTDRYILNKVNIVISLHRSHDNFVLCRRPTVPPTGVGLHPEPTNYKVKLIEARLAMKRYQPTPAYLAATENRLLSSPALYPYL